VRALAGVVLAMVLGASCALPEQQAVCGDGQGSAELFGSLACDLCASRSCCTEAAACAGDAGCAELMRCYQGCAGEAACFEGCRGAGSSDAAVTDALVSCVSDRCESDSCVLPERAATCAAAGSVPDVLGDLGCDLCVRRNACAAATACADNPACAARITCMASCTGEARDPACFDMCRADGQFGVGDAQLFAQVAKECREECRVGQELACVGRFAWPTTSQTRVSVTHHASNRAGTQPFSTLDVTACAAGPGTCSEVGEPATVGTDADGLVTVNVPTLNTFDPQGGMSFSGFRGYLRFTEPSNDPAVWLPTTLQHMRPEYRDRLADEIAPFASGTLMTTYIGLIADMTGVTVDPARGVLVGGMVDCHGTVEFFAPDIAITIANADSETRIVYVDENQSVPDFTATATTIAGQYFAINVPVGNTVVTLRHVPSDTIVAESPVNILAGEISVLAAWPRPE
jgi:hypothetical protein